jgi:hypothetical protein
VRNPTIHNLFITEQAFVDIMFVFELCTWTIELKYRVSFSTGSILMATSMLFLTLTPRKISPKAPEPRRFLMTKFYPTRNSFCCCYICILCSKHIHQFIVSAPHCTEYSLQGARKALVKHKVLVVCLLELLLSELHCRVCFRLEVQKLEHDDRLQEWRCS